MPAFSRLGRIVRPDLFSALRRFPAPMAAALTATVVLVLMNEDVMPWGGDLDDRIFLGAAVAFTLGVAGRIFLEARGRSAPIVFGDVAPLALGGGAALGISSLWLNPPTLIVGLALLVIAAPGVSAGGTPIRFWIFNVRSIFAGIIGAVGAGAFVFGFWAILATLRGLFDLPLPTRLVAHAVAVSFAFVLPAYWLAFLPRISDLEDEEPQPDVSSQALAGLTDFVFIPLLLLYAVILHVYAAKVALDAALPRNQIGWMVSIFLVLGYLTFLLAMPQQSPLPRVRDFFRSAWPLATPVPVVLLVLALQERINAYGITEERWVVALIALTAMLLLLAWLPRRRLDPRVVPAAAAGLLLIGSVGPLASRSLTVHSQARRLIAVLDASGELKDGRFDGERTTPWGRETREDLLSIVRLLDHHKALHLIAPIIGENHASNMEAATARLGLNQTRWIQPGPSVHAYARIDDIILTDAFAWRSDTSSGGRLLFRAPGHPEYALKVEDRSIVLSGPHGTAAFDLTAKPELPLRSGETPPRLVNADRTRAVLILRELRWSGAGESRKIHEVSATILLR